MYTYFLIFLSVINFKIPTTSFGNVRKIPLNAFTREYVVVQKVYEHAFAFDNQMRNVSPVM